VNEVLRGKIDPLFLATEILEMDFQEEPHRKLFEHFIPCDPEQKKEFYALDLNIKKRMILWPRGLFKTSAVVVHIVQLILNFPNIRIMLLSGSVELAKQQLERIKSVFEEPTEKFEKLYPEFCGQKLGNQSKFTVPNRKRSIKTAQPTVWISTARSTKSGSHCDIAFIDDLVNDQNYQNPELLETCWNQYCDIGPLVDPGGYIVVTGTPYNFGDTYERIEEAARKEMKETGESMWLITTKSCWIYFCAICGQPENKHFGDCKFVRSEKRDVLFKQFKTKDGITRGHSVKYLEGERREKGDDFFAMQYECQRLAKGMQAFTEELINAQTLYYFEKPVMESEMQRMAGEVRRLMLTGKSFDDSLKEVTARPPSKEIPLGGWTFIIGDLSYYSLINADSRRKRDRCVFFVVRVVHGALYLIASYSGRWKSGEVGMQMVTMYLRHQPKIFYFEALPDHEVWNTLLNMIAVQNGLQSGFPMEWLPMGQEDDAKLLRIGSVHGWLAQKKLWLFSGMSMQNAEGINDYDMLCDNLKKWPKLGKHDDYGDLLGQTVNAPHGVALELIPHSGAPTLGEMVKRLMFPNGLPYRVGFEEKENSAYSSGPCGSVLIG
jgi:hypothetical protein